MHVSLYRKYRPQSFSEVVGQAHVTQTLKRAVEERRVAHAFLFSGPRGTGKTSTARILAKALNCERGGPEPCNQCSSCVQVTEGSSLDVVEIDAASHGSVDDARELREKVAYASVGGRWKVYIIDECHMLSPAANNALLKVLEEPPQHVVFVFATTEPQKVLQTLVDRCQRYDFRAIGTGDIAERIQQVCDAEGIWIDPAALSLVAGRAAGSVRDGLSLLEQLRSFAGERITPEAVAELLGQLPDDLMFEALDLISERHAGGMFTFADRLIRSGSDIRLFTHSLVAHLRSLFLVLHAPAAQEILDISDERLERLRAQANHFASEEVLRLLDLANEAQLQLREGAESRLALEVALTRMARPDLHASPSSLLSRLERLERLAAGEAADPSPLAERSARPAPRAPAQPSALSDGSRVGSMRDAGKAATGAPGGGREVPPAGAPETVPAASSDSAAHSAPATPPTAPAQVSRAAFSSLPDGDSAGTGFSAHPVEDQQGPLNIERIERAWPLILDSVKRRKISFRAMLLPARPVRYKDGELVLAFGPRSRFHKDQVSERTAQIPLLEAFEEIFGERPKIRCVLENEPAEARTKEPSGTVEGSSRAAPMPPDDVSRPNGPGGRESDDKPSAREPRNEKDQATAAIELIREAFAGAEVVDE